MFRNDCFDMVVNLNERDIIISNIKNNNEINNYINTLRNFYNIKKTIVYHDIIMCKEDCLGSDVIEL